MPMPMPPSAASAPVGATAPSDPQAGARQQAFVAIIQALQSDPQLAMMVDQAISSAKMQQQQMQADSMLYGGGPTGMPGSA